MISVISLWQPWASLCFADLSTLRKVHETRHFKVPERLIGKRIALHAAKKFPTDIDPNLSNLCEAAFDSDFRSTLPRGAIIGTAILTRCILAEKAVCTNADRLAGNYAPGRFAWRLAEPERLITPFSCKGRQKWFSIEDADFGPMIVLNGNLL